MTQALGKGWGFWAAAALATAVFIVDLLLPLGAAVGVLYVLLVALSLRIRARGAPFLLGGLSACLLIAGFYLSPPSGGASLWQIVFNRGASLGAVAVTSLLCDLYRQAYEQRIWQSDTVKSSPDAHSSVGLDGMIHSWNPAAERLFGYSSDEAVGRHISILAPLNRKDEPVRNLAEIRAGRSVPPFETVRQRKDGHEVPVRFTIWPVFDDEGNIVGASSFAADLSERKKLESDLAESRGVLNAITESSPDYIMVIDRDYEFLFINRTTNNLTPDEVLGRSIFDYTPPNIAGYLKEKCDRVFKTGEPEEYEVAYPLTTSEPSYFEGRLWPVLKKREVVALAILATDVTDRRHTEAERDRFFQLSQDLMVVLSLEGTIQRINPAFERALGYREEEQRGRHFQEFCHPEDLPVAAASTDRVARGEPGAPAEVRSLAKDGSYKWFNWAAAADLEAGLIFAVGRDLTERKEAEARQAEVARRLDEERNLLRTLIDSIPDPIYIKDREGRFLLANTACAAHAGVEDATALEGQTDADLISDEQAAVFREREAEILRSGRPLAHKEESVTNRKGERYWYSTTKLPLRDGEGRITRIVGISRDVTALKRSHEEKLQVQAQLRQAQRLEALGVLAGGVAHDFNNILTAICGYAALARDSLPEDSRERLHLEEVLKASERARGLVQQILAFSQGAEESKKRLNVATVVKEDLKLVAASLPSNVELRQEIDSDCGWVLGDPTQLHQVVMNLCTNASQAIGEKGGALKVSLERVDVPVGQARAHPYLRPGEYVRLGIADTGHGIDPKIADRIYEPFFTTKSVGEGSGLGLSVVHGIVTSHGGAISFESVPGQGATFFVHLPLLDAGMEEGEEPQDGQPPLKGSERVLFVDDEAPLAELGKEMLEKLGYTVTAFSNSEEALRAFRKEPQNFDVVVTDLTMPFMTGIELGQKIMETRRDLPLVLTTGFSDEVNRVKAEETGFRAYVAKPFVSYELATKLRQALRQEA